MDATAMPVGIVGHGRFGRALGDLLEDAGVPVRAYDAAGAVEPPRATGSLAELAAAARTLIVAVPVPAMHGVFEELAQHVGSGHLVLDAGSVKTRPVLWMDEIFADAVPWAATHPLFGPTSIALGERPLRAVVCPNPRHPEAVQRAAALFRAIGCEVTFQDADAHDRAMAEQHALAYFIAKGLLDAGVDMDSELAPPSARGLARTIASVRSDAGHLFAALHRENPHAGDARRRFIEALQDADTALRAGARADAPDENEATAPVMAAPEDAELAIPDLGTRSPALREVRDLIDELDRELVSLLARRAQLAHRAAEAKASLGAGVRDRRREEDLLRDRAQWAAAVGLDPVTVEDVFSAILRFSRRLQAAGARDGQP